MAESKAKTAQNNHHHNRHQDKEIAQMNEEIDELEALAPSPSHSIYEKVHEQAERFATTSLGQYVIVRADRILKTIEETAKWSVPQVKLSPISVASAPLERPLPWIPFLFLIIVLRVMRLWLSVGALMIGNAPVSATDMVYFIQVRRRKLRALRVHGLKVKQRREQESKALSTGNVSQPSFISKLRNVFSRAICQPGMQHSNRRVVVVHQGMLQEEEMKKMNNQSKETVPKHIHGDSETDNDDGDDDVGFEDDIDGNIVLHAMSVHEMIEKYAKDSSGDDSDYIPNEHDYSDDDSITDDSEEELLQTNGVPTDRVEDNNYEKLIDEVQLIKENGDRFSNAIPLPFIEIKKESISDDNNGIEKRIRNGTKEHDSESVAAKNSNKIETPKQNVSAKIDEEKNVEQKSTPGHISAAISSTRAFNSAAIAASTNRQRTAIDNDTSNSNQLKQANEIETNPSTYVAVAARGYSKDDPTPLPTFQTINDPVISDPSSNISANLLEAYGTNTTWPSLEKCDKTDTLTPATSSEDLFYSPIGSPTEFNADLLPPSILKQPTVVTSSAGNGAHSTPISEAETEENDLPAKKHVTLQNQQKQQELQQQNKQQQHKQEEFQPQHKQQQQQHYHQQQNQKQHGEHQQQQQQQVEQKHKQHEEQQQQQLQQQHEEQHHQQQQYQKHNNHNNRYRGRNRR